MPKYTKKPGRVTVNVSGELPEFPTVPAFLPEWWEEARMVLNRQRDDQAEEFTTTQVDFESATVWSHTHGLGRYPLVQVVDDGGSLISPTVQHVSVNEIKVTHSSDVEGTLILY